MLKNYVLPIFYEIDEIKRLFGAQEVLIGAAKESVNTFFEDLFVLSASQKSAERYEKIMRIEHTSDDIEYMRKRLFLRINEKLPYTEVRLYRQLTALCGEDTFKIFVLNEQYRFLLRLSEVSEDIYNEVMLLLEKMLPVNLIWSIVSFNLHRFLNNCTHRYLSNFTHHDIRAAII